MFIIAEIEEKQNHTIDPYDNFNNNISNLKETIEIFPKIIKAFSIIYDFLIEELENDPNKEETLRELSYKIHKSIDSSAKKIDFKDSITKSLLLGAAIGTSKSSSVTSGALTGVVIGLLGSIDAMIKDSSDPKRARELLEQKISEGNEHNLILKLCYVHQITILEGYLRDTLISALEKDTEIFKSFIEKYSRIKQRKFKSDEIFKIKKIIFEEYIENHVFHKVESDTRAMYLAAFNVDILKYNKKTVVLKIVKNRHDIIHKNSIGKNGKEIIVKISDLEKSLETLEGFVVYIEEKLNEKGIKKN